MSSVPVTQSIGKTRWTQGGDNEAVMEIRIPMVLPAGVRPRDLTVEVKDSTVLCIRHDETRILQWRLYAPVKDEVEWRVENESTMVLDLEKKTASVWSCLLDLPVDEDDELFVSLKELDRMFAAQLPVLPPISADNEEDAGKDGKDSEEKGAKAEDEDDLDKLLDEAAEEVAPKKSSAEDTSDEFVKAELDNYKVEAEEIGKKLTEVEAKLVDPADNEATETAKQQKEILSEMLRLHNECRELRSQPSSLDNFIKCTMLDLLKARVNIGATEEESEDYDGNDEKSLSAAELMACGLKLFEDQDIKGCLHFLRLAAIHHKHEQSIMLLYNIYSQLGSPRGTYFLLRRALDDDEPSALANQRVGELYDQGGRHFLPLFPAALHFFQRAARLGSVNAMLSLAQLWLRGGTASTMLSEEQMEEQKSLSNYHAWLQKAIDRGCGSAYFVRGCMYIKGEHGMKKSYQQAKDNIDAAASSQPEIIRRAPQILQMLEAMRQEEEAAEPSETTRSTAKSPASPGGALTASGDEDMQVTPSMARLNALSRASPSGAMGGMGGRSKRSFSSGARRKAFWERACVTSVIAYGVYTLAFPLRVVMLPFVYTILGSVVDALPWLGNTNTGDANLF